MSRLRSAHLAIALLLAFWPGPAVSQVGAPAQGTLPADSVVQDAISPEAIEAVTDERAQLDESIRNRLQAVFDRVESLAAVDVVVEGGVVRLEGTVVSSDVRSRAAALAADQEGVLFVDNRIRESTSLEEQLQPTWARLRELGHGVVAKLPLLAVAALIVGLAGFLGWLVSRWRGPAFLQTRNPFLQNLIRRFLQVALFLAGIVVALDLLAATALVGVVIGTAGLAGWRWGSPSRISSKTTSRAPSWPSVSPSPRTTTSASNHTRESWFA